MVVANKDQLNFCVIAIDAHDCGYISQSELVEIKKQWDEVGRLLNGFMAFLKSQTISRNTSNSVEEDSLEYSTFEAPRNGEEDFLNLLNTN